MEFNSGFKGLKTNEAGFLTPWDLVSKTQERDGQLRVFPNVLYSLSFFSLYSSVFL